MSPNKSDIENTCKEFLQAFDGKLTWTWEERTHTALAEISKDDEDLVRSILSQHLDATWDDSNIESAPDTVRIVESHLGALRSGQELLTSNPENDLFIFCAWWPWGNGKTISIRMSPYCNSLSDEEKSEIGDILKELC